MALKLDREGPFFWEGGGGVIFPIISGLTVIIFSSTSFALVFHNYLIKTLYLKETGFDLPSFVLKSFITVRPGYPRRLSLHLKTRNCTWFSLYDQCMVYAFEEFTIRGCHGCDHVVVWFTTTCAISTYHHLSCQFESGSWGGVLDTTLCGKVCQWLAVGRWFSSGTPVLFHQ